MVGHHPFSSDQLEGSRPVGQGDERVTVGKEGGKAICVAMTSLGVVRQSKKSKSQYMKRQRSPEQRARCKGKGRDGQPKGEAILTVWETTL